MKSRSLARSRSTTVLLALCSGFASAQTEWPGEDPNNQYRNEGCTYLNGLLLDRAQGMSRMADGRILVAGETTSRFDQSTAHPAWAAVPPTPYHVWANGASSSVQTDGFVAIFSEDMSELEQWAYIGGCDGDRAYYAEADEEWIFVVGITKSIRNCGANSFPLSQPVIGATGPGNDFDVFVARFDLGLTLRQDSIVIAGDMPGALENARSSLTLVKDSQNQATAVYISGTTPSANFPVAALTASGHPSGTLDHTLSGTSDAFLIRFGVGASLTGVWATFYGGGGDEYASANVRYHAGLDSVFIGGLTTSDTSSPIFIPGAPFVPYDGTHNGSFDGFVARFDATTGAVEAATYLGGSGDDRIGYNDDLELTPGGNVAVAGATNSTDFPIVTSNAPQATHSSASGNNRDLFITVLDSSLSGPLLFSTYFGGTSTEEASGLAVDNLGRLYLTGETGSADFPLTADVAFDDDFTNALGSHAGGYADGFIIKLDPASTNPGRTLKYSTFLGGDASAATPGTSPNDPPQGTRGRSMLYDVTTHTLILAGQTTTNDLPTTDGVQFRLYRGEEEGFIARHFAH